MYYSLAQIIVIARGGDEGWMNILVLVVLAAVYGIGALIKAKGKQSEDQAQEQQARKPQRKPSAGGRGILEQLFREFQQAAEGKPTSDTRPTGQTTPQKTVHSLAAARKYAIETKQARQTAPAKSKLPKPVPQVQKAVVETAGKRKRMPAHVLESSYLSEIVSAYEDPDELKRAILHYEILGKPLALRNPM